LAVDESKKGKTYPPFEYEAGREKIREYANAVGEFNPVHHDPEVGIDFARMLHGSQEFEWGEPVCAGDTITTETTVEDLYERTGMEFFVFKSVSKNQEGDEVVRGTWTNIVRGG